MPNKIGEEEHSAGHEWVVIDEVAGPVQAEILRGLLEAQGITVNISMEGVGRVHGFFVGPLATNQVLVPDEQVELARQVLQDYYAGVYEQIELESDESDSPETVLPEDEQIMDIDETAGVE